LILYQWYHKSSSHSTHNYRLIYYYHYRFIRENKLFDPSTLSNFHIIKEFCLNIAYMKCSCRILFAKFFFSRIFYRIARTSEEPMPID
jgi:hypothetical protein